MENASFVTEYSKLFSINSQLKHAAMATPVARYGHPSLYHAYIKFSVSNAQKERSISIVHSVKTKSKRSSTLIPTAATPTAIGNMMNSWSKLNLEFT